MLTEELEDELRRAFARAAAGIPEPEQARQRLLQRDYRPGRGHRRLAAGITAATAVAAVVLGLGLTGAFGSAPAPGTGTIRTAAFTLVEHANGTATLTIKPGSILDSDTLQNDLRQYGIPAIVTTDSFCSSEGPPGFSQVVTGHKQPRTITINPAAMPADTELTSATSGLPRVPRPPSSSSTRTPTPAPAPRPPIRHPAVSWWVPPRSGWPGRCRGSSEADAVEDQVRLGSGLGVSAAVLADAHQPAYGASRRSTWLS